LCSLGGAGIGVPPCLVCWGVGASFCKVQGEDSHHHIPTTFCPRRQRNSTQPQTHFETWNVSVPNSSSTARPKNPTTTPRASRPTLREAFDIAFPTTEAGSTTTPSIASWRSCGPHGRSWDKPEQEDVKQEKVSLSFVRCLLLARKCGWVCW
jgi:hypothetical protein